MRNASVGNAHAANTVYNVAKGGLSSPRPPH